MVVLNFDACSPKLPRVRSRDDGCYTEEVVMSICVMFGEDCIAIYLIIGYWNQVSLGVLKSIYQRSVARWS